MKRTRDLLDLLGIDLPIVLAPMAGNSTPELVAAVSNAGGLGSYGCAMLSRDQLIEEAARIKALTNRSFNLNFFCHAPPNVTAEQEQAWRVKLAPYYQELGVDPSASASGSRRPFDAETCDAVLAIGPKIVSFHFGMPDAELVRRLKAAGTVLMSSATTSAEARCLVELGADVVVAQGFEAGGHRGMFLTSDINTQVGTMALIPQVVDAVAVPVIASGGIADARGVAATLALGAAAAQIGTAYLLSPQAKVSEPHRAALRAARDDATVLTNLFTGRPARGLVNRFIRELGPINATCPQFPTAANALTPLRAQAERRGSSDFSPLWSGQAAALVHETDAAELTRRLATGALEILGDLGERSRAEQQARRAPAGR
jgi:nitronate monooxygenase